eukprot:1975176-Rhodomonas_salina.2
MRVHGCVRARRWSWSAPTSSETAAVVCVLIVVLRSAKLRGFPKAVCDTLGDKDYVTTIHAINSAILKMARVSAVPSSGFVYRGLKNLKLPDNFFRRDMTGCKGLSALPHPPPRLAHSCGR